MSARKGVFGCGDLRGDKLEPDARCIRSDLETISCTSDNMIRLFSTSDEMATELGAVVNSLMSEEEDACSSEDWKVCGDDDLAELVSHGEFLEALAVAIKTHAYHDDSKIEVVDPESEEGRSVLGASEVQDAVGEICRNLHVPRE